MYKVTIDSAGKIFRESDNVEIGTITGFYGSDFRKYPNTLKKTKIKLYSEEQVTIVSGGFLNGQFIETCHIKCVWDNCVSYKLGGCIKNSSLKEEGFYIL